MGAQVHSCLLAAMSLGLAACGQGEPSVGGASIPGDSISLIPLDLPTPEVSDTSEGGYIVAANDHRISYTPMRFPGAITIDLRSGHIDTAGGVSGEGPGQFRYPIAMWYRGDTLLIVDRPRSKLIAYLRGIDYLSEESITAVPQRIVPDGAGRLAFSSSATAYGGLEDLRGGGIVSFPPRMVPRAPGTIDQIAVVSSGQYAIYDATAGAIVLMDSGGNQVGEPRRLPEWLSERLLQQMKSRSDEADDPDFVGFPEAKFLIGDQAGSLYLFYYLEDPAAGVAVKYSPATDKWTRVAAPGDSLSRFMVSNAFDGVIVGSTLHITRSNGMAAFRIQ